MSPESGYRFRDKDMQKIKKLKRKRESERSRHALAGEHGIGALCLSAKSD
jgi:hypothetical protein